MIWKSLAFVLAGGVAVACGNSSGMEDVTDSGGQPDSGLGIECTDASPSFSKQVEPIFANSGCGGSEICHGSLLAPGGGTTKIWPYDSLVNVKASRDTCDSAGDLVKPGNLHDSYLLHKLTGIDMCPGTARMPKIGSPLSHAKIQTIADWICAGAKND